MSTGTDLITVRATPKEIAQIEEVANECRRQLQETETPFAASFTLAAGVTKLESLITNEMMADIMALQGKKLGFKTDKDKDKFGNPGPGYEVPVVRQVFIEATVRGFRPVNNEFNIIAGNFYGAQTGFERLVKTFPGLTDLQESFAVPEHQGSKALVAYVGAWQLDGEVQRLERKPKRLPDGSAFDDRFVVRVNANSTDDAVLGKAKRKAYAAIYDILTGCSLGTPEGDVDDILDAESRPVSESKVQPSTLFSDDPAEDGPVEDQAPLLEEYRGKLGECQTKPHIGQVAKQAGGDKRLTDASRKAVMGWCGERRKEV